MKFSNDDILDFQLAIASGDIATARSYLDKGLNIDATSGGYTALYKTIHRRHEVGYLEWLKFLLDARADPNHTQ